MVLTSNTPCGRKPRRGKAVGTNGSSLDRNLIPSYETLETQQDANAPRAHLLLLRLVVGVVSKLGVLVQHKPALVPHGLAEQEGLALPTNKNSDKNK